MSRMGLWLWILMGALVVGCGGSKDPDSYDGCDWEDDCGCGCGDDCGCGDGDEDAAGSGGGVYTPDKGTATIKGVCKFEGKAPRRRKIDMGSEQFCVDAHRDSPILSETAIVSEDGGLKNVFVSVKSGLKGWKFETPSEPVMLDQNGCTYVPHMIGMQKGQALTIRNSDPIMHNVHAFHLGTKKDMFNFGQSKRGQEDNRQIQRTGMVQVKCDVHGWMGSYIGVVNHPFHSVSGDDGAFSLEKLPPGTYKIEAWHEKYGKATESVTVGDGETKEISFTFKK